MMSKKVKVIFILSVVSLLLFAGGLLWYVGQKDVPVPVSEEYSNIFEPLILKKSLEVHEDGLHYYREIYPDVDIHTIEYLNDINSYPEAILLRDADHVYHIRRSFDYPKLTILDDVDPQSFIYLSSGYFKDKDHVFLNKKMIKKADSDTFEYIHSEYSKDKSAVFLEGEILADADPATFKHIDDEYWQDSTHIFYEGESLIDVNTSTFERISERYAKDNTHIFFKSKIVDQVDYSSFEWLSYDIAKDKNHVFTYGNILPAVDVDTYRCSERGSCEDDTFYFDSYHCYIKADKKEDLLDIGDGYSIGKYAVYYTRPLWFEEESRFYCVPDANPKTFRRYDVGDKYFYADDTAIFSGTAKTEKADPHTFEFLKGVYAKDKNHGYHRYYYECHGNCVHMLIPESDGKTFEVLDEKNFLSRDKDHVYFLSKKIEGADPDTFRVYEDSENSRYFFDKEHMYVMLGSFDSVLSHNEVVVLEGIDPESFDIIYGSYIKDASGIYNMNNLYYDIHLFSLDKVDTKEEREKLEKIVDSLNFIE
ncbi:MAG: DKNYY domain-containing protein [Candidatus Magasanikbacteria bacterium]|jgi:hypothetical protein|nr:DKNYY domain-containing protein [Candidatus Magasanikbacteria bacterium]